MDSHEFRQFDYGIERNQEVYGTSEPPAYNLNNVRAPVTLFYGNYDALVPSEGIERLIRLLPNVRNSFNFPYNHFDLVFSKNRKTQVFDKIIESIEF